MTGPVHIQRRTAPTFWARIYIAGDYQQCLEACRAWCEQGACVTVEKTRYIYTGGDEAGLVVGFINYPRFPDLPQNIEKKAEDLARALLVALHQHSVSIETPTETVWLTRRQEDAE